MKKKILIAIIGFIITGALYLGIEMSEFADGVKEGVERNKLYTYINSELHTFYEDYKTEITEIVWSDEPPAKLHGVIFLIDEKKSIIIELDSIPENYRMNLNRNWKVEDVGKSKIRNIKLVEKN